MTTRISVELVPRSVESLLQEAQVLRECAPWADTINLPDLTKFELRSWDAARDVRQSARPDAAIIPHLRAVDFDPDEPLPFIEAVRAAGVRELLLISGDVTEDSPTPGPDLPALIRRVGQELPEVDVYVGLDPYRQGMADEMDYLARKVEAGAVGVFTQPFFDTQLIRTWSAVLPDELQVWWGATTVTTERSKAYWNRRNRAVFPTNFDLSLQAQRDFAQRAIDLVRELDQNLYLMPVRTSPVDYLAGLHVAGAAASAER